MSARGTTLKVRRDNSFRPRLPTDWHTPGSLSEQGAVGREVLLIVAALARVDDVQDGARRPAERMHVRAAAVHEAVVEADEAAEARARRAKGGLRLVVHRVKAPVQIGVLMALASREELRRQVLMLFYC